MNKFIIHLATLTRMAITIAVAFTGGAIAQSTTSPNVDGKGTQTISVANTQTVDARQSGAWTVGIDPAKNTSEPLVIAGYTGSWSYENKTDLNCRMDNYFALVDARPAVRMV